MALYQLDDIIDDMNRKHFTNKFVMLKQLGGEGIQVPEAIYADESEYEYFQANSSLSSTLISVINNFVSDINIKGYLPLFSIRCEKKVGFEYSKRPPITIVNVGSESLLQDNTSDIKYVEWCHIKSKVYESFKGRACKYDEFVLGQKYVDKVSEICNWVSIVYNQMKRTKYLGNRGIIIQRMIMGNLDDKSGSGICCNWPGDINKKSRFKGVFIPNSHGIPVTKGCWGEGELNLCSLESINPKAYYKLYDIFCYLEEKYGDNPYLEFTVEKEEVYILQYEIRQRLVLKTFG